MIEARTRSITALARRLANRARDIATAHAESTLRDAKRDPWRWRDARLLWPDSHKGD